MNNNTYRNGVESKNNEESDDNEEEETNDVPLVVLPYNVFEGLPW